MSESNAMPIPEDLKALSARLDLDLEMWGSWYPQAMKQVIARCIRAEQRVQELEAALEALLDTHNCDDGSVDYKGTETECPVCIPPRALLSKGAQPKEEA